MRWRAVAVAGASVAFVVALLLQPSPITDEELAPPFDALTVTDRRGEILRVLREGDDSEWLPLAEVDPDFVMALVAVEDQRFHSHAGVDGRALVRALLQDVTPGRGWSGGSTITQQLVKLLRGRRSGWRGLVDKAREVWLALELERRLSKTEILEQYVNRLPFGGGVVGVERASQSLFGHSARDLSLSEATLLAGLPQAPSRLHPRRHFERALRRRETVLARVAELGLRDAEAIRDARRDRPTILPVGARPYRAPQFVERVHREVRARRLVPSEHTVRTSLDARLQEDAEALAGSAVERFRARGASNGAAIVVANATGEVLAYVGSALPMGEGGALDLLRAKRQPGSTLKPFLAAAYFAQGAGPASHVEDVAAAMTGARRETYVAANYDRQERGPVSVRRALAGSLNLASLDIARRVGDERFIATLHAFHLGRDRTAAEVGAAGVLGGVDVTASELASAYVALARRGEWVPLRFTPGVAVESERVVGVAEAALVEDILEDRVARREGFGRDLAELAPGEPVALKTGTSQDHRDAWCVVYDATFTVLVWLGDPSGEPMQRVSGFEAAAPVALRLLHAARSHPLDPAWRVEPEEAGLVHAQVCAHTGLRPGPRCTHVVEEVFAPGALPTHACAHHDEAGQVVVSGRLADWARRARPEGIVVRSDAPPRVLVPAEGARLVSTGPDSLLPLRAEDPQARFEVDGTVVPELWAMTPGLHTVVANVRGRRGPATSFTVIASGN